MIPLAQAVQACAYGCQFRQLPPLDAADGMKAYWQSCSECRLVHERLMFDAVFTQIVDTSCGQGCQYLGPLILGDSDQAYALRIARDPGAGGGDFGAH